jgi:hypothetical protein
MSAALDFDLRGKDWLTEAEAAHYCGVSLRQFQDHARAFNARRFMGKKLYSKNELHDSIMGAPPWQPSTSAATAGISTGARTAANADSPLARLSDTPLRPFVARRKRS